MRNNPPQFLEDVTEGGHGDSNSTEHTEIWTEDTMVQKCLYQHFQLKPKDVNLLLPAKTAA